MIIFEKIRYKNILSVGNTFIEVPLNTVKKTLIVGKNGNGKSTILDALLFCLFGKPYRKTNKPILINSKNKSNLLVEIEFSIGKKQYKISRGLKPNIFEIYCDNILINQNAASKDYQEYLEKYILKVNYNSFINVVILGAARYKPFMSVTTAEKRNIIEELLDIQIFSTMNVLVKDRISKVKEEYINVNYSIDLTKEKIDLQKQNIEEHKLNKLEQINEKNKNIEKYNKQIEKTQDSINLIQKHIDVLVKKIQDKEKVEIKKQKFISMESKIETNIDKLKKEIEFYEKHDNCPICKQSIESDFKIQQIEKSTNKKGELDDGLVKLSEEMTKITDRLKEIQTINKHILDHNSEIVKLNASIIEIQKYIKRELDSINVITNNVEKIELNDDKLNVFIEELKTFEKKLSSILEDKKYYDFCALLLKDGGIKTRIIKQYLPTMNKLINAYLTQMNFYVNFNINENFEEIIKSRYRDEFKYENFSEGEKTKIDISILFAFRQVAKMKNSINTNLLIMDEILDSSLDSASVEYFLKLIDNIENTNIIIVSHRADSIDDKFDRVLKFEKVKDFTRVKEI